MISVTVSIMKIIPTRSYIEKNLMLTMFLMFPTVNCMETEKINLDQTHTHTHPVT